MPSRQREHDARLSRRSPPPSGASRSTHQSKALMAMSCILIKLASSRGPDTSVELLHGIAIVFPLISLIATLTGQVRCTFIRALWLHPIRRTRGNGSWTFACSWPPTCQSIPPFGGRSASHKDPERKRKHFALAPKEAHLVVIDPFMAIPRARPAL